MLGFPYTIQEIAAAGIATDLFQGLWPAPTLRYVSFDTRTIAHGADTIFVALSTSHRDGHDFIESAYQKGVRHFITERPISYHGVNYLLTDNALSFLQRWAYHHRLRVNYPIVAITGSNGKTTVKEWAATLLEMDLRLVKSPMSYNSQLGVAISLLHLPHQADLALIEAGISKVGEMETLAGMIQPDLGVLTHMGTAHADGFASEEEKIGEKLLLFDEVEKVFCLSNQEKIIREYPQIPWVTIGAHEKDAIRLQRCVQSEEGWALQLVEPSEDGEWERADLILPLAGEAHLENALSAIQIARHFGVSYERIAERLLLLRPVEMRTELITDHPQITIINDAYNSDLDSVRNAFQQLMHYRLRPRRIIVLSDIPHQGDQQVAVQQELLAEAVALVGADQVFLVGPVFHSFGWPGAFLTVEELQRAVKVGSWTDSTVLLKGARNFSLERLIPWLQRKPNATFFRIDLDLLVHNFRYLKSLLPAQVRVMAMVKAASYGGGTWEIAQTLIKEGVDYLAVAYPSEGIVLREAGIEGPIMIMNPDPDSVETLIRYDLEPEVSHFRLLDRFLTAARLADRASMRIHLKIETGMGRLGFQAEDMPALIQRLIQYPDLRVVSVLTHLAAADDVGETEFSMLQIRRFLAQCDRLHEELGIYPWRHVLNTAGVLHMPDYAMEMVRFGIGLYGVDPTLDRAAQGKLIEIGSLHAFITQVATYPAGTSVGYGRSQFTERLTRIATLPIGYADGIPRALGNGAISFLVHGKRAATFGRICMDMLMLDVTDIPEAQAGDEVVLIGRQGAVTSSVEDLARAAGTIPYEILVRISPRVRRIFEKE